ncbi:hypothetical protein Aab01nite_79570 [Paractinoplanes abujensis]|uniref:Sugar lactone lactonase YvrE n=1 Tax=Paractinoplanes abujensis TaxID=882441 RepID=A0A7W7CR26_9ACTN|nr:hypothetical protein [Actinoplanes abujensis]MBB4693166.1 hypothetical protein [Actinoplanes abujensis]GID24367.1 hypothetical protein Aab01nite_79570 [Actinoplanes abujensis]
MNQRITRALLAAAVLASGALLAAPASAAPATRGATIVHLDLAAGQMPENVVPDRGGSVDVTFAGARQVARLTPYGKVQVLATLPAPADPAAVTPLLGFPLTSGLVRDGHTFYVLYATGSARETGVWTFSEGAAPRKLADLPADGLPNGLALDDRTGTLYVTDSARGAVYAVTTTGRVRVFSTDAALAPAGFFGVNGAKIRGGHLYVSNLDRGTLLRTPLSGRGAGVFTTIATGLTGIDDFAFTGPGEQVLAGLVTENRVVLAGGGRPATTVLTAADGLSNPTAVLIHEGKVFVPSAAYTTQKDPNLLVTRLARSRR